MKLGKKLLMATLLSGIMSVSAVAEDNMKYSVGYTGMYYGNYIQGISARASMKNVGLELNYGNLKVQDTSINLYTLKGMYTLIEKHNSKFYIGVEGGIVTSTNNDDITNDDITIVRPFFGSEYFMKETPELSFSWEAGYLSSRSNGNNVLSGTSVSVGVHYYF